LAGGADALGAALVRGLRDMGLLKTREPLAFRDALPGVCPSEGAMVAVLEHADHAQRRGAPACARIEGYASGFEPTLARRHRASTGIAFTMQRALAASGRAASEIDLVMTSAHGTPVDDPECEALSEVFGEVRSPVLMAPKMAWGECFAAAPVLSLALATALLQPPVPTLARGLAFALDGAQARVADAETRLGDARLAMVHGLCYSGPSVALVVARDQ